MPPHSGRGARRLVALDKLIDEPKVQQALG